MNQTNSIPPHRSIHLPGVHAYADAPSVTAGEALRLHVSSSVSYTLSICRLGERVGDVSSDVVMHTFPPSPAFSQPIHPGSYVHVADGLSSGEALTALTLECWVRLWEGDAVQGIITQFDESAACGLGLFVNAQAELGFYLGDGGAYRAEWMHKAAMLSRKQWHHIVGVFDGATHSLWVDGAQVGAWAVNHTVKAGQAPLRLGAYGKDGAAIGFLDSDLAMPAIYARALSAAEIRGRFAQKGLSIAQDPSLLACWPLSEERGAQVADVSGHARHGQLVNHGTWMIGGPSFDGQATPRYGVYEPKQDGLRGHGLRLASDDLYDCRWDVTHEYTAPADAKSGLYVARIHSEQAGKPYVYDFTFIVRKSQVRAKAPVLVICATNTWRAYAATPFAQNQPAAPTWRFSGLPNSHPLAPAYSCYVNHRAGQPTYQQGMRLPWPNAVPDALYNELGNQFGQWTRNERCLHHWLDQQGYAYDVVSDLDVHREPDLLQGYQVVFVNGHSEYWTIAAYEGLDRYLSNGGNAIVLSGNTMFWRVSFDDESAVMECRKYDPHIGGREDCTIGETFHSQDGKRGSLMRECGYAAWRIIGLDTLGWAVKVADDFGVYRMVAPKHFLFNTPESLGVAAGGTFGHAPGGGQPHAIGHEWDVRLSTMRQLTTMPWPKDGVIPDEPAGMMTLAYGLREKPGPVEVHVDFFAREIGFQNGLSAEMIYWERPQGGRVFHAGVIAYSWALPDDPKLQILMRNVLHHFGVRKAEN